MSFEKGPQLETEENQEQIGEVAEMTGGLISEEGGMIANIDSKTFKKLKESGKLKKFIGAMILTSTFTAGMSAKSAEGGQDWRRIGDRVEDSYNRHSRSERVSLENKLRALERMFREVDSEGASIAKKYEREIGSIVSYANREISDMLEDTLRNLKSNMDNDADRIIDRYEGRIDRALHSDPDKVGDLVHDLNVKLAPHMDQKSTDIFSEYLTESNKIYDESNVETGKLHNKMLIELEPYKKEAKEIEAKMAEIQQEIDKNERNQNIKDTATSIFRVFRR